MGFVKNEKLLGLSPENLALLEKRAELHRRFSAIEFKVLECTAEKLVVRVVQEKSQAGNYFDQKRLVEIVRETFGDLGAWPTVQARPIPYTPPGPDVVTPEWIQNRMKARGVKVKDLAAALGVDANTISAYKNGVKPLSAPVKAMFYYFFTA
jgi:DNA-binding Xre family transcriptional regulator